VRIVRVWVQDWEMQCCGDPFAIAADVEWGLLAADDEFREWMESPLGGELAESITHREAHHQGADDPQPMPTRGRVESIEAVYWRIAPRPGADPRMMHPVSGTAVLERREKADGWEPEVDGGPSFQGYIVELTSLA
jgi:hypothetical protein